jgi:crossover junction endodeoxyribonuclease RuvC
MTRILGIDPGIYGAIALYDSASSSFADVADIPIVGKPPVVNFVQIVHLIKLLEPESAVIERVHAMPKQGRSSIFRFGEAYGGLCAALAALSIPTVFVTPQKWKAFYGLDSEKENSRRKALELFPAAAPYLTRKLDHQRAEAMLIAKYGATKTLPTTEPIDVTQLERGAGRSPATPA